MDEEPYEVTVRGFLQRDGSEDTLTTNPMSPCTIAILEGSRKIVGYMLYHLDSDSAVPVVYDRKLGDEYVDWSICCDPLSSRQTLYSCTNSTVPPRNPCLLHFCICNEALVYRVPYAWALNRREVVWEEMHWMQRMDYPDPQAFVFEKGSARQIRMDQMEDTGKTWKALWIGNKNPFYVKLEKLLEGEKEPQFRRWRDDEILFDWERLPMTVYEVLAGKLDGISLINLCNSSPLIDDKITAHFTKLEKFKREELYRDLCVNHLDRKTFLKVLSSFDNDVRPRALGDRYHLYFITWEAIFHRYRTYWNTITSSKCRWNRMTKVEEKLRDTALVHRQATKKQKVAIDRPPYQFQRSLGGRTLMNVIFPLRPTRLNVSNFYIFQDFEKANCKHSAPLCRKYEDPSHFQLQVAYYPYRRAGYEDHKIPEIDRVILSVCNKCVTITAWGGGDASRFITSLPIPHVTEPLVGGPGLDKDPIIFEIRENIVALWHHPQYLGIYMLQPVLKSRVLNQKNMHDHAGYHLSLLYTLPFPKMGDVWSRLSQFRLHYIPYITEHKGKTAKLNWEVISGESSDYIFHPTEPTYYGLAFVSPIYGVESFRPKEYPEEGGTLVESFEPQMFTKNGRKYLKGMRQPKCSAKGHGMFVFCSNTTIGISFDGITWIYTDLIFPEACFKSQCLKGVEVLSENGLMFILNNSIVLMEIKLDTPVVTKYSSFNEREPELKLKPLRVFQLDFDWRKTEVMYAELSFNLGRPFLFVVADGKPLKLRLKEKLRGGNTQEKLIYPKYGRMMGTLDFEN